MAFNLGAFAGGLVSGGLKTYTTLKEQERLEGIEARDKERFENERLKLQQEKEADEQLRQATLPDSNGVSVKEITSALDIGGPAKSDIPPEKQALYKELFGRFTPEQQEQMRSNTDVKVDKKAYREKFNEVFGGLTEKQQEAVLRGYGKVALPDSEGATMDVSLGDKGVYTDQSGTRRVGALETDEKKILENRKRIAAQSGNPIAIKRAEEAETAYLAREASRQGIKKTGYELGSLERQEKIAKAVDDYSTKQANVLDVLGQLSNAELGDVPAIVNKQLGAFGFTAKYTPASGDGEGENSPSIELKDGKGKVVASFKTPAEVQAALNEHMDDFHTRMSAGLVNLIPNPADQIKALKDIKEIAKYKHDQIQNERRLSIEEKNVDSQITQREEQTILSKNELEIKRKAFDQTVKEFEQKSKIDVANLYLRLKDSNRDDEKLDLARQIAETEEAQKNQQIGLEASRLNMEKKFGERRLTTEEARQKTDEKRAKIEEDRSLWEKNAAEARNKNVTDEIKLNRDKFVEDQKLTPGKIKELDAHVKLYNAEAKYRDAAAKELGTRPQDWKVLGTDTDGTPISMDSKSGKFARSDGAPIKDIDFFRKITGVAPDKATFTGKDLNDFTLAHGDDIVAQKDGQKVKLRDLPLNEQAAQARAFFNGTGAVGSGGLDSTVKPAPPPTPASALPADAKKPAVTILGDDPAKRGLPVTAETAQAGAAAGTAIRNTVGGAASAIDTSMTDAGTLFLKGKIARKEPLTLLEQAQAKRAGLLAP